MISLKEDINNFDKQQHKYYNISRWKNRGKYERNNRKID